MDNNLRKQIYDSMNVRETDYLVEIWQENDRKEWSDLAFSVIREILINRLGELPIQTGQVAKKEPDSTEIHPKYPRNKILLVTQLIPLFIFALLFISKVILPDADGGWSDPPVLDVFPFLGVGVCISIFCIIHSYYAWTLDAKQYFEWSYSQTIVGKKWARVYGQPFIDGYVLWSTRIMAPMGVLFGIMVSGFSVFMIISFYL